jgi:hypothetical protein
MGRRRTQSRSILYPEGTVEIPSIPETVIATRINSVCVGAYVEEWVNPKIEPALPAATLRYAMLTTRLSDFQLRRELGDAAETTFAQVCALIEKQQNGEDGVLKKTWSNVFYVTDAQGITRSVMVDWCIDRWNLVVFEIMERQYWNRTARVFSRI